MLTAGQQGIVISTSFFTFIIICIFFSLLTISLEWIIYLLTPATLSPFYSSYVGLYFDYLVDPLINIHFCCESEYWKCTSSKLFCQARACKSYTLAVCTWDGCRLHVSHMIYCASFWRIYYSVDVLPASVSWQNLCEHTDVAKTQKFKAKGKNRYQGMEPTIVLTLMHYPPCIISRTSRLWLFQ